MASRTVLPLCTVTAAIMLASCSGGSNSENATLSLGLSDAPVDGANAVVVNITGVHMHSPDGDDIIYQYCDDPLVDAAIQPAEETAAGEIESEIDSATAPEIEAETEQLEGEEIEETMQSEADCETPVSRAINLLALTGGESVQLLDGISVKAGKYPWIRLAVDESDPGHIELLDGTIHPLSIPSGAQTGLKLNSGFTATVNGGNEFMIDFDLRKSVRVTGRNYKLRPTLRMVKLENTSAQRLTGTWTVEDMGNECASPMAYVYAGVEGVVEDDIGGANTNPLTTSKFVANEDGATFSYQVDYIDFGEYTVAYTCDGSLDSADIDDDIQFVSTTTVTISDSETAETAEPAETDDDTV